MERDCESNACDGVLETDPPSQCPYVDRNDPRCGSRFALGHLEQTFGVCFGTFHACPMYHRIHAERLTAARARSRIAQGIPLITITAHGTPLASTSINNSPPLTPQTAAADAERLRKTGT